MLVSALESHNNICCHGEIYHADNPTQHIKKNWHDFNDYADFADSPLELAYSTLDGSYSETTCRGFKMWYVQAPDVCDSLCDDKDIKKIILVRENKLASYSSALLAKSTGVWNREHKPLHDDISDKKVRFNRIGFLNYIKKRQETVDRYLKLARGESIYITYDKLGVDMFSKVLDFLGQEKQNLNVKKKKLHSSNILERFSPEDHDQIITTLHEIDKPGWIEELTA